MDPLNSTALEAAAEKATNHLIEELHTVLDRLNGTSLTMTEGGFRLDIPPRKEQA